METDKKKQPYEAPQLDVVQFKVERGYASSGVDPMSIVGTLLQFESGASQNVSQYGEANDWASF